MKVGIVGNQRGDTFGVSLPYMRWGSQFGDVTILTPDMDVQEYLDLVIMVGGIDLNPLEYGQRPAYGTSRSDPHLSFFDNVMLPKYIKAGVAIFGICRGFQALNVHFGGTLTQHIYDHPTNNGDRKALKHKLHGVKGEVNSMHHQALDKIGEGLEVLTHFEGVPEAIQHETLPIGGVQWHPEEINDEYSRAIVEDIVAIHNSQKMLSTGNQLTG